MTAKPIKDRRPKFGRLDIEQVYEKAKELIRSNNLFRVVQVEDETEVKKVIICNLWRVEKLPDGSTRIYKFLLNEQKWVAGKFTIDIPLFPISSNLKWWDKLVSAVTYEALEAAGLTNLTIPPRGFGFNPGSLKYVLKRKYLKLLDEGKMRSGCRALRAAIFQHLIDKPLLSAALAIHYNLSLDKYLIYSCNRKAVLRVSQENHNLLPLLRCIHPKYWNRSDLFSYSLWVRRKRRKLVDYERFNSDYYRSNNYKLSSFKTRTAWRWLLKAPLTVVKAWTKAGCQCDVSAIENIARANIGIKLPAITYYPLLETESFWREGPDRQQLIRLYLACASQVWKANGYQALKGWVSIQRRNIHRMFDWLCYEGFEQGHPHRNSSWESLTKHTQEWCADGCDRFDIDWRWSSELPATQIEEIRFTPLESTAALMEEGDQMHHCVADYAYYCHQGEYRVFRVQEPDGTRSTLGLHKGKDGWDIDQHQGVNNSSVSIAAIEAAKSLIVNFRQNTAQGNAL